MFRTAHVLERRLRATATTAAAALNARISGRAIPTPPSDVLSARPRSDGTLTPLLLAVPDLVPGDRWAGGAAATLAGSAARRATARPSVPSFARRVWERAGSVERRELAVAAGRPPEASGTVSRYSLMPELPGGAWVAATADPDRHQIITRAMSGLRRGGMSSPTIACPQG
jgi:hypothetical protein